MVRGPSDDENDVVHPERRAVVGGLTVALPKEWSHTRMDVGWDETDDGLRSQELSRPGFPGEPLTLSHFIVTIHGRFLYQNDFRTTTLGPSVFWGISPQPDADPTQPNQLLESWVMIDLVAPQMIQQVTGDDGLIAWIGLGVCYMQRESFGQRRISDDPPGLYLQARPETSIPGWSSNVQFQARYLVMQR